MTLLHKRALALPAGSFRARSVPGKHRLILFTGCAVALGLLLTPPAAAQFTCAESGVYDGGRLVNVPDDGASASNQFDVACGTNANAISATASLFASTAFGANATASASGSTAVGGADFQSLATTASGVGSTAIGLSSKAIGLDSTAVGRSGTARSASSIAIGSGAVAGLVPSAGQVDANTGTIAIGPGARAGAFVAGHANATAVGIGAVADAASASAFGNAAAASGMNSTALGASAAAQGNNSMAIGHNAAASGARSIAIGLNSSTAPDVLDAVALGTAASASGNRSVAIGRGSVADVGNVVSVGAAGAERRIINVRRAVDPTDAVNLAQVQDMIAAAPAAGAPVAASVGVIDARGLRKQAAATGSSAAAANSARNAGETGARKDRLASLGDGGAARTAQPVASLSCEFGGGRVTTAVGEQSSASSAFALVQQSGISFQQGGTAPGCVTLSFSAEVVARGSSIMEVRAVLDGSVEASPGPVLFAQEVELFNSRAFSFLFPDVAPGPHRVEIQFRNAGEPGFVRVGQRTTMVQFAR